MGLLSSLFGKKKAKYVIDKEDDQSEFLKSDSEMRSELKKKTTKSAEGTKKPSAPTKSTQKPASKSATEKQPQSSKAKSAVALKKEVKKADPAKTKAATPKGKAVSAKAKSDKSDEEIIDFEKTVAVKEGKETRSGKFDVRRAKDGRFFFCLYASNHAPIAYSQIYSSVSAAMNGIDSIISNSPKAPTEDTTLKSSTALPFPKWEIYIDKAGEYRFRLYATNGLCICHASHGYSTKAGCKGGIESIKRFAAEAKVDKSYLN